MGTRGFEELRVYQLAEQLADRIWDMVQGWPNLARDTVGKQIFRSADSIGANIAEGSGRGTYQDNRRFVRIARGSLYETRHLLRRAYRRQLLPPDQIDAMKSMIDELGPKLNAYLRSIGTSNDKGPMTND
jgi:four helix bundle protein